MLCPASLAHRKRLIVLENQHFISNLRDAIDGFHEDFSAGAFKVFVHQTAFSII